MPGIFDEAQRAKLCQSGQILSDAAHFAAGRRYETLEVAHTTARFMPCQQQNAPRQRRNHECKQALGRGRFPTARWSMPW